MRWSTSPEIVLRTDARGVYRLGSFRHGIQMYKYPDSSARMEYGEVTFFHIGMTLSSRGKTLIRLLFLLQKSQAIAWHGVLCQPSSFHKARTQKFMKLQVHSLLFRAPPPLSSNFSPGAPPRPANSQRHRVHSHRDYFLARKGHIVIARHHDEGLSSSTVFLTSAISACVHIPDKSVDLGIVMQGCHFATQVIIRKKAGRPHPESFILFGCP